MEIPFYICFTIKFLGHIFFIIHFSVYMVENLTVDFIVFAQLFFIWCSLIHLHSWKSLDCHRRREQRMDTTHSSMTSRILNFILVFLPITLNRRHLATISKDALWLRILAKLRQSRLHLSKRWEYWQSFAQAVIEEMIRAVHDQFLCHL